jgi:hypothetical protein
MWKTACLWRRLAEHSKQRTPDEPLEQMAQDTRVTRGQGMNRQSESEAY